MMIKSCNSFSVVTGQRKPIKEALFLNTEGFNSTLDDCVWRREREPCPDPNVALNLYTEAEPFKREVSSSCL